MDLDQLTFAAASGGQLALGLLVARAGRSSVAPPLVGLCLVQAGWTFCALAYGLSGDLRFHFADVTISPWALPTTLHVILAFSGRARRFRAWLVAAYVGGGLLSASSVAAFGAGWARVWIDSAAWSLLFLMLEAAIVVVAAVVLVRHLRQSELPDERARTRLILAALLSGAVLGATELWGDLGLPVRHLGNLASLASGGLLALATLRHRLLERSLRAAETLAALLVGTAVVVAFLGLVLALRARLAELVIFATAFVALVSAVAGQLWVASLRRRRRLSALAFAGKLGEQLAHDLKNPLGALSGAIQFLEEERAQGRSLDAHAELLGLMGAQAQRIERVVDRYQRIGTMQPLRSRFDLNALVQGVVSLQPFASGGSVQVRCELCEATPGCDADRDLVGLALENLLRNAAEAMPEGGMVTVRTMCTARAGAPCVALLVADEGVGMDARQCERAFDELYTTKAHGTGLGLAFVRRVAEAHGGGVELASVPGRGTRVELWLPATPPAPAAAL